MSEIILTITKKKPDGTVEVQEFEDPIATMVEQVLAGQKPQSRLEAVLSKGESGGGGSSGGNNNQEFFTDEEIEDIWNSV